MHVNVKVEDLLEKLRENRENHRELFLRAQAAFQVRVEKVLLARLEAARRREKISQYLDLVEPVDQTSEYDTAISMMEMCADETIKLDARTFQCYVLDKWTWHSEATRINSAYATDGKIPG